MSGLVESLRHNAFSELDITNYVPDTHGWMDDGFEKIVSNVIQTRDRYAPLTIFEVGSWKGKSCITIANTVKKMGFTNVRIIAIDTWLGAPEFWTWGLNDSTRGGSLKLSNGYPNVFYTFTKNIKYFGHADIVSPFPISSIQAADILTHYNIKADLIYVDASHEYVPVKADIAAFWPLLNDGGCMIGDDYSQNWPGVVQAVNEFGKAEVSGIVWKFMKDGVAARG
jgi:Methyltransferase domain